MDFDITITDPCLSGTNLDTIVISPTSLSINDGDTGTVTFTIPQDDIDKANTVQDLCGARTYTILDGSSASISYASIAMSSTTARTYVITIDSTTYPSHFSSSTSLNFIVQARYDDYTGNSGSDTTLTGAVTLEPVVCNCNGMQWTAPSIVTTSVNVAASSTPSLNAPAADTTARSSTKTFDVCYENSGTCDETGSYAAAADFRYKAVGGSYDAITNSASGWISFSGSTLTIAPTDPLLSGVYYVAATWTPTSSGTAAEHQILTITVNCEVTSMTKPSAPTGADLIHDIKGSPLTFDFTTSWVQVPACGYTYSSAFTWTGVSGNAFMTQTAGELIVQSYDSAENSNTYALTVYNDVTIANNGATGSSTFSGSGDTVDFTITLRDGCVSATLVSPTLTNMAVDDGNTQTQTFADASDTFGAAINQIDYCGVRTYSVVDQGTNTAISWVSVAVDASNSANFIITANPSSTTTELQTTHNARLVITAPATPTDYTGD